VETGSFTRWINCHLLLLSQATISVSWEVAVAVLEYFQLSLRFMGMTGVTCVVCLLRQRGIYLLWLAELCRWLIGIEITAFAAAAAQKPITIL
jgi:hypothetical protein